MCQWIAKSVCYNSGLSFCEQTSLFTIECWFPALYLINSIMWCEQNIEPSHFRSKSMLNCEVNCKPLEVLKWFNAEIVLRVSFTFCFRNSWWTSKQHPVFTRNHIRLSPCHCFYTLPLHIVLLKLASWNNSLSSWMILMDIINLCFLAVFIFIFKFHNDQMEQNSHIFRFRFLQSYWLLFAK